MAIKINGNVVIDDSQNSTLTGFQSVTGNVTGGNLRTTGMTVIGSATPVAGTVLTSVGGAIQLSPGNSTQEGIRVQREAGFVNLTGINNDNNAFNGFKLFTSATASLTVSTAGETGVLGLVNLNANGVGNIGAAGGSFNTVFARATSAQYADVAERYTADAVYAPGTVLMFGGTAEVTVAVEDATPRVAGVVTTNPALLMNDQLMGVTADVALLGRVPVRVVGSVSKGDMLVSAGQGRARAESDPKVGTVIGKSLETVTVSTGTESTVEVVVGRI
jgi:hypothetical protein